MSAFPLHLFPFSRSLLKPPLLCIALSSLAPPFPFSLHFLLLSVILSILTCFVVILTPLLSPFSACPHLACCPHSPPVRSPLLHVCVRPHLSPNKQMKKSDNLISLTSELHIHI